MKRLLTVIILVVLSVSLFSCAYGKSDENNNDRPADEINDHDENVVKQKSYYLEDGTFVRENVVLTSDTRINNMNYVELDISGKPGCFNDSYYYHANYVMAKGREDTSFAVVKKVGSISYYKENEAGEVLAYTVSELELTQTLYGDNCHAGETVYALECYAFAPDDPEAVYWYPTFFNNYTNTTIGIMEYDKEYAVLLWDSDEDSYLYNGVTFYSSGDLKLKRDDLPEGFKYVVGFIYPVYSGANEAVMDDSIVDLCLPLGNDRKLFKDFYSHIYDTE